MTTAARRGGSASRSCGLVMLLCTVTALAAPVAREHSVYTHELTLLNETHSVFRGCTFNAGLTWSTPAVVPGGDPLRLELVNCVVAGTLHVGINAALRSSRHVELLLVNVTGVDVSRIDLSDVRSAPAQPLRDAVFNAGIGTVRLTRVAFSDGSALSVVGLVGRLGTPAVIVADSNFTDASTLTVASADMRSQNMPGLLVHECVFATAASLRVLNSVFRVTGHVLPATGRGLEVLRTHFDATARIDVDGCRFNLASSKQTTSQTVGNAIGILVAVAQLGVLNVTNASVGMPLRGALAQVDAEAITAGSAVAMSGAVLLSGEAADTPLLVRIDLAAADLTRPFALRYAPDGLVSASNVGALTPPGDAAAAAFAVSARSIELEYAAIRSWAALEGVDGGTITLRHVNIYGTGATDGGRAPSDVLELTLEDANVTAFGLPCARTLRATGIIAAAAVLCGQVFVELLDATLLAATVLRVVGTADAAAGAATAQAGRVVVEDSVLSGSSFIDVSNVALTTTNGPVVGLSNTRVDAGSSVRVANATLVPVAHIHPSRAQAFRIADSCRFAPTARVALSNVSMLLEQSKRTTSQQYGMAVALDVTLVVDAPPATCLEQGLCDVTLCADMLTVWLADSGHAALQVTYALAEAYAPVLQHAAALAVNAGEEVPPPPAVFVECSLEKRGEPSQPFVIRGGPTVAALLRLPPARRGVDAIPLDAQTQTAPLFTATATARDFSTRYILLPTTIVDGALPARQLPALWIDALTTPGSITLSNARLQGQHVTLSSPSVVKLQLLLLESVRLSNTAGDIEIEDCDVNDTSVEATSVARLSRVRVSHSHIRCAGVDASDVVLRGNSSLVASSALGTVVTVAAFARLNATEGSIVHLLDLALRGRHALVLEEVALHGHALLLVENSVLTVAAGPDRVGNAVLLKGVSLTDHSRLVVRNTTVHLTGTKLTTAQTAGFGVWLGTSPDAPLRLASNSYFEVHGNTIAPPPRSRILVDLAVEAEDAGSGVLITSNDFTAKTAPIVIDGAQFVGTLAFAHNALAEATPLTLPSAALLVCNRNGSDAWVGSDDACAYDAGVISSGYDACRVGAVPPRSVSVAGVMVPCPRYASTATLAALSAMLRASFAVTAQSGGARAVMSIGGDVSNTTAAAPSCVSLAAYSVRRAPTTTASLRRRTRTASLAPDSPPVSGASSTTATPAGSTTPAPPPSSTSHSGAPTATDAGTTPAPQPALHRTATVGDTARASRTTTRTADPSGARLPAPDQPPRTRASSAVSTGAGAVAAAAVTSVVVAASLSGVGLTSVSTASRVQSLRASTQCFHVEVGSHGATEDSAAQLAADVDRLEFPFFFTLAVGSDDTWHDAAGGAVSNALLCVLAAAGGLLYYRRRCASTAAATPSDQHNGDHDLTSAAAPGRPPVAALVAAAGAFVIPSYLAPPTVGLACAAAALGGPAALFAACGVAAIAGAAPYLWATVVGPSHRTQPAFAGFFGVIVVDGLRSYPKPVAVRWFVVAEVAVAVLVACTAAIADCAARAWTNAVLCACYTAYAVGVRPLASRLETGFHVVLSLLQLAAAIPAVAVAVGAAAPSGEAAAGAELCLLATAVLLLLQPAVVGGVEMWYARKSAARPAAEVDALDVALLAVVPTQPAGCAATPASTPEAVANPLLLREHPSATQ